MTAKEPRADLLLEALTNSTTSIAPSGSRPRAGWSGTLTDSTLDDDAPANRSALLDALLEGPNP